MIKAACVNIDISHPLNFAVNMKEHNLAMAYHGVFNDGFRTDGEVEAFMQNAGVRKRYASLHELANAVDIGFIHDCNWDKHIAHAMPFIEAGKPVFIDKPLCGSLCDCLKFEELVKHGARIIGSSSIRYALEITELKKKIEGNNEKIVTVFGTAGSDDFNYGVHIVEGIHGLLGKGALSAEFLGFSGNGNYPAGQYLVNWANGVQVIYQLQPNVAQKFHLLVTTDKSIYHITIDTAKIYGELLKRIEAYLRDGRPMASIEELTEVVKIFLAAKKSRENGGIQVALQDLQLKDSGYDGYLFETEYAKQRSLKK